MLIEKTIQTYNQEEFIEITSMIKQEVANSNVKQGEVLIFIPHTTAAITINENADTDVKKDILQALKSLNLEKLNFSHMEGNSPAHFKTSLLGTSQTIIINNLKLMLGTWQGIFFCEFDGPRKRKILIQIKTI